MKKALRVMTLVSFVASSLLFSSPANAAPNDLTTINAADAVALLTNGSTDITVVPGSEVAFGSMNSFTSIDLSRGFELPQAGVFLNSQTSLGADNTAASAALRSQLETILSNAGVTGDGGTVTNVSALTFDFTTSDASIASLEIDFMFASSEFFISDWDIAAVIVDGVNYAFLPNGNILRVRQESALCNFAAFGFPGFPGDPGDPGFPGFEQNPDPVCQNIDFNQNYSFFGPEGLSAGAPAGRIGALLDQNIALGDPHTITFAVGDTGDEIVPSYLMFSLVQGSIQTFGGLGGIFIPTLTVPDAPTAVVATATGKTTATVSFEAPAYDGDSTISSYTATSSPGGITKTLTQAGGGTFEFTGLQPGTAYTFSVTANNAVGSSAATTSNSIKTKSLIVASISSLTFADDGTGTGGRIVWTGKDIDAVLYSGPEANYPGAFNYGAFTGGWDGRLKDLLPDTTYTASIFAVSEDGVGVSKTFTFKTGAKKDVVKNLSYWATWVNENTYFEGEARIMLNLLSKFDSLTTSEHRTFIKVPVSRVATVLAKSLTPDSCMVEADGVVNATSGDTCTISYTVTGGSKAPATLVKDFKFVNFKKK
jgi:hypothetical protein